MAKKKTKTRKRTAIRDLGARNAKAVKGGGTITVRKAGKGQQEF